MYRRLQIPFVSYNSNLKKNHDKRKDINNNNILVLKKLDMLYNYDLVSYSNDRFKGRVIETY